jgi:putative ABC transport system permease protein
VTVRPKTEVVEDGVRVLLENAPSLTIDRVGELRSVLEGRADVATFLTGSGWARRPGEETPHAVLIGATTPEAVSQVTEGLLAGRYLSEEDIRDGARVVVVPRVVADWYAVPPEALPGTTLELDGETWEIIGVEAAERGGGPIRLHVPLSEAQQAKLERPDRRGALAIRANRVEDVEAVTAEVSSWLEKRYGDADLFVIASNRGRVAQAAQAMLVFKLVMGAIAGISLLVGGIGIMNILLASVFERTREIGIRKATGARNRDILLQFLAESVTITGAGSLVGVSAGLAGAFLITAVVRHYTEAQVYAAFTWGSVLVAAGAALLVGLIFGTYPARRAAALSPIDAIRHE